MGKAAAYSPDAPPGDFSREVHEGLESLVAASLRGPFDGIRLELLYALQAIVHRFCALAEHSDDFTESFRAHGQSPPQPHRYIQQRELFEFFENGHAAVEAAYYAAYLLGALVQGAHFPLASEEDRRRITPRETTKRFGAAFPDDALTGRLQSVLADERYEEWSRIRNVLAHRLAPGRIVGVECRLPDGRVVPPSPAQWNGLPDGISVVIDDTTASTWRDWLAKTIGRLLEAAAEFVSERIDGLGGAP